MSQTMATQLPLPHCPSGSQTVRQAGTVTRLSHQSLSQRVNGQLRDCKELFGCDVPFAAPVQVPEAGVQGLYLGLVDCRHIQPYYMI